MKFTPKNKPIYLGIFPDDMKETLHDVKDYILDVVGYGTKKCGRDELAFRCFDDLFTNYKSNNMKLVQNLHLTTCFIGHGPKSNEKLESKYCTQFREGQKVKMKLVALVYVPYKIITGIVKITGWGNSYEKPLVENEFPHMTLMTGDWKPVDSNAVLEVLSKTYKKFRDGFKSGGALWKDKDICWVT